MYRIFISSLIPIYCYETHGKDHKNIVNILKYVGVLLNSKGAEASQPPHYHTFEVSTLLWSFGLVWVGLGWFGLVWVGLGWFGYEDATSFFIAIQVYHRNIRK